MLGDSYADLPDIDAGLFASRLIRLQVSLPALALSEKAWKHIRERHPEVSDYRSAVVGVASNPQVLVRGQHGELKAVKLLGSTHLGQKYLVVVYKERKRKKDIITAYFTSDLRRVRGEIVWRA